MKLDRTRVVIEELHGRAESSDRLYWRMNELTAAVGLGQLEKVDRIVQGTYNKTLVRHVGAR